MKVQVYLEVEDWRAVITKLRAGLNSSRVEDNVIWCVGRDRLQYVINVIEGRLDKVKL